MTADGFEATFVIRLGRQEAWQRLTAEPAADDGEHLWLAGFDASVTVAESDPPARLQATKDDEPCASTEIVVTLEDSDTGTRIHVVQSGFGDWLAERRDMMTVGWHLIVADMRTYLATGVHPGRFLRSWADVGADARPADGAVRIGDVRPAGLAAQLGLAEGDLLVELHGAPVTSLDDLVRAALAGGQQAAEARWIRSGVLMNATSRSARGPIAER